MPRPTAAAPTTRSRASGTAAPSAGAHPVDELWAAISLLTRIRPLGATGDRTGAAAFGLVGAILGSVAALPLAIFGARAPLLGAALGVALLALLSGALHLDGLADIADSLAAPNPEAADRARRDPRIGAVGAATLVLVLVVDVAALSALVAPVTGLPQAAQAVWALIVAAAASRAVPALAAPWVPVAGSGFGAWFGRSTGRLGGAVAVATALVLALIAPGPGPKLGLVAGLVVGAGVLGYLGRRFGSISGDGFGTAIELAFAAALVVQVGAG